MNEAVLDQTHVRRWRRHEHVRPIRHRWITTLPSHWNTSRISWLFETLGSGTTPNTSERSYYDDGDIPWVNTGDLNDSVVVKTQKCVNQQALRDHSALKLYPSGTLLVALYGATIGKVGLLSQPATVNQACFAMGRAKGIVPAYLLYWLIGSREHIVAMSYGGGQPNISGELIRSLRVPVPPLAEQRAIAAFLDREAARIDALIGHKERMIALLEEKRQAVITHAVTAGLDPVVKLRNSGVPWLGCVPDHWEIKELKYSVEFLNHRRIPLSAEERGSLEKTYPYYGASGIIDQVDRYLFDEPLILIAEDGANLLSRSTPLAFIATGKYWVNNHAHILKPKSGELLFWAERLNSISYEPFISGAAQPKLTIEALSSIQFAAPGAEEQSMIAAFVQEETRKISPLIARVSEGIERLREYRTALISAAVTGQINVREEVDLDD